MIKILETGNVVPRLFRVFASRSISGVQLFQLSKMGQSVTVVSNVQQVSGKEQCLLIPRVVGASFELALSGLSEPEMVVIVEWTLKDRATQTVLWLATVEGKSKEVMGTSFTYQKHKRIRYQKLFDDLSRNTAAAFASSPEIKRLAQPER